MVTERSNLVIGIRMLFLALAKAMLESMGMTVGASSYPTREKSLTDLLLDLLPTYRCANVSWTLLGVALLVSMAIFEKSLQTLLAGKLDPMHEILDQTEILVADSVYIVVKYKCI